MDRRDEGQRQRLNGAAEIGGEMIMDLMGIWQPEDETKVTTRT